MFGKDKVVKQLKSVQRSIEQCVKDEYTVGYYNGLEYTISVLTGGEPCYKMYEGGGKDEEIVESKKITTGGYIKRKEV